MNKTVPPFEKLSSISEVGTGQIKIKPHNVL